MSAEFGILWGNVVKFNTTGSPIWFGGCVNRLSLISWEECWSAKVVNFNTVCVCCFVCLLNDFWYLERNVDWLKLFSTPVGVFSLGCMSVEFRNVGRLLFDLSS